MAAADVPATMRGFVFTKDGGMRLDAAAPVPTPKKNQLLVKVHSAGLNPVDYKTVLMPAPILWLTGMTSILGRDFSGVVVRSESPSYAVGDHVYGNTLTASVAEYAICDATAVAKLPASVSHAHAASLPVAALTALQAFEEHGKLKPGDRVFVPGASGGTGTVGVQIAKCLGASVVAGVCSAANADMVRSLGADVVADYAAGDDAVEAALRPSGPFDMTYDCVTSAEDKNYEPLSRRLLKSGGMHVAINGVDGDWMRLIGTTNCGIDMHRKDFRLFTSHPDSAQLTRIVAWVAEGKLRPVLDSQVPFDEAAVLAAYAKLKGRRTKGKIVVNVVAE